MSDNTLIYISHYGGDYTWLLQPAQAPVELGRGDAATLAARLGEGNHSAQLIIGGAQVVIRTLAFAEREKRHLRRLMPFQLEEEVVGDIDQFHFALSAPEDGKVSLAYTEKAQLESIFSELAEHHIEITHCTSAALLVQLPAPAEGEHAAPDAWALHWQDGQVSVRHSAREGFCVAAHNVAQALALLLNAENRVDALPTLVLSAPDENQLAQLREALPASLAAVETREKICAIWDFAPDEHTINLCQGPFSQRLPIERWWRLWRTLVIAGAAALVVYLATLLFSIHQLKQDNLQVRREIESVFRTVVANGPATDPERQLKIMARNLQPQTQGSHAVALLGQVLPLVDKHSGITLRGIYYTAEAGELSLNVQAETFNAIESLRGAIEAAGLSAKLLSANAQGNTHTARLKIKRGTQ